MNKIVLLKDIIFEDDHKFDIKVYRKWLSANEILSAKAFSPENKKPLCRLIISNFSENEFLKINPKLKNKFVSVYGFEKAMNIYNDLISGGYSTQWKKNKNKRDKNTHFYVQVCKQALQEVIKNSNEIKERCPCFVIKNPPEECPYQLEMTVAMQKIE